MKEVQNDKNLIAFCGLYCGACGAFLREKCPGCAQNSKATWCKIRACCMEKSILSCADCTEFADKKECGKLNNFISKATSLFTRSDRPACLQRLKETGYEGYAKEMADKKAQAIKK